MTQSEGSGNYSESREQTECIEDGCEYGVQYLEEVPNGYRLTCGEHAGDTALDLAEFEWGRLEDSGHAPSVDRLRAVGNVRELWLNEWVPWNERGPDDGHDKTASLMIRDGDGEIVGESERYGFPGIWALVCVDAPENADDYRRDDPAEKPDWVEWVWCDPPMEHHVMGVRCAECGEERIEHDSMSPRSARYRERWDSLWFYHRPDCSHASDRDEQVWWEKQRAIKIRSRPTPRVMALDCLWEELRELHLWRVRDRHGYTEEPIRYRFDAIFSALRERMQPNYPECSECGGELVREDEWAIRCVDCYEDATGDVYDGWWEQHRRLWGTSGQGERGWSIPEGARR